MTARGASTARWATRAASAALLGGLAATAAAMPGVTLEVEPVIAYRPEGDPAVLSVGLRHDGSSAVTVRLRALGAAEADHPVEVSAPIALPRGARKRVTFAPTLPTLSGVTLDGDGPFAIVNVRTLPRSTPIVAVVGAPPASLARAARGRPSFVDSQASRWLRRDVVVAEAHPDRLPQRRGHWPNAQAWLWSAPRSSTLDARQVEALRAWLLAGGHLVAGTEPEEPGALVTLGLVESDAPREGAWRVGFGRMTRFAGPLTDRSTASWDALRWRETLVDPLTVDTVVGGLGVVGRERPFSRFVNLVRVEGQPPLALASAILAGAFGLVVVPRALGRLRRSGRRARPARPARVAGVLAAATTACAVLLAATRFEAPAMRTDVIDVDRASGVVRANAFIGAVSSGAQPQVAAPGALVVEPWALWTEGGRPVVHARALWLEAGGGAPSLPDRAALRQARHAFLQGPGGVRALVDADSTVAPVDQGAGTLLGRAPLDGLFDSTRFAAELALDLTDPQQQWAFPESLRWPRDVPALVVLTPGVSVREVAVTPGARRAESWTITRWTLTEAEAAALVRDDA